MRWGRLSDMATPWAPDREDSQLSPCPRAKACQLRRPGYGPGPGHDAASPKSSAPRRGPRRPPDTDTLGGATITGDTSWDGAWDTLPIGPHAEISSSIPATTAAVVKIQSAH